MSTPLVSAIHKVADSPQILRSSARMVRCMEQRFPVGHLERVSFIAFDRPTRHTWSCDIFSAALMAARP